MERSHQRQQNRRHSDIMNNLVKHNWFKDLIDDCKGLVTEAEFNSRWTLIVAYHAVGERIVEEKPNFEQVGVKNINSVVAEAMNRSTRHVQRCVQFYKKYPDLDKLPGGKAVSWRKVVNEYLPESTSRQKRNDIQRYTELLTKDLKRLGVSIKEDIAHKLIEIGWYKK